MIVELNQICKCDRYKAQLDMILNPELFTSYKQRFDDGY